jgi:hypothetical protein
MYKYDKEPRLAEEKGEKKNRSLAGQDRWI